MDNPQSSILHHSVEHHHEIKDEIPSVLRKVDKWLSIENMGEAVGQTKFIPMKTPFSSQMMQSIRQNKEYNQQSTNLLTIDCMLNYQKNLGRDVGLILDVSDHMCLYSQDIPNEIEYQQVRMPSKQIPSRESLRIVFMIAQDFWERQPDKYIAIHCAYGFNRTGFTLCSYLIEVFDMTIEESLRCFEVARSPGIKHEDFIEELSKRYRVTSNVSESVNLASSIASSYDGGNYLSFPIYDMVHVGRDYNLKEVDNESLGFEQREVLSAFLEDELQQCDTNSSQNGLKSSLNQCKSFWDIIMTKCGRGGQQSSSLNQPPLRQNVQFLSQQVDEVKTSEQRLQQDKQFQQQKSQQLLKENVRYNVTYSRFVSLYQRFFS
eukprot:TRINITY_DN9061_c0_g1_i5.p2 TRINITY_DN9061_c0_g1~~TRINITY_DN9061_c0_g1_i5.p2  ORF type:complete len:396 (-),score=29.91 TRINITY_DN9061_c0_g1_i5:1085-2212(-)